MRISSTCFSILALLCNVTDTIEAVFSGLEISEALSSDDVTSSTFLEGTALEDLLLRLFFLNNYQYKINTGLI